MTTTLQLPANKLPAAGISQRLWISTGAGCCFWMVGVAFALRLLYIGYFHAYDFPVGAASQLGPALDHYAFGHETGSIARSIATGHGFSSPFGGNTGPTAWIAPVYPALCALVFKLFGVYSQTSALVILTINSIFSALTCIPIYKIGERTVGRAAGLAAGWIFAAGVVFMRWATTWIWEVSLSALLLSIIFLHTLKLAQAEDRTPWMLYGLLWGATALINPALLGFLPFAAAWAAWHLRRRSSAAIAARRLAIVALVFMAMISPWLLRNRAVFGRWIFIRSNAGFEFSLANYHLSNGMGWPGRHPTGNINEYDDYTRLGEIAYIHSRAERALQFVRRYPGEFCSLIAIRLWAFWYGTYIDYASSTLEPFPKWSYWPLSLLTLLGLITMIARGERAAWLFAAAVFVYPLPYYVTFAEPRYRHALEPLLVLIASYFVLGAGRDIRLSILAADRKGFRRLAVNR